MGKKRKSKKKRGVGAELVRVTGAELMDSMVPSKLDDPKRSSGRFNQLFGPPPLVLRPGEKFRLATRMHWFVPAKDVVRGLADFPIAAGISFVLGLMGGVWWVTSIVWAIALTHQAKYAYHVLRWRARVIVVTDTRLITTQGVLTRGVDDKNIAKIKGFAVDQSFTGRVFGYGHMIIKVTGGTDSEAQEVVKFVPKPYDVYAAARGAAA